MKRLCLAAVLLTAVALLGGCACRQARVNTLWSPELPAEDFVWSTTTNVFPLYSVNKTAFSDRIEETGNVLIFISWEKVTPRLVAGDAGVAPERALPLAEPEADGEE